MNNNYLASLMKRRGAANISPLEWILGSFLAILLITLVVIGALWWHSRAAVTIEEAIPEDNRREQTAKTAHELALPAAEEWAADAQLVEASATWPRSIQFDPQGANWNFIFYSAAQNEIALITAVNGRASLFNSRPAETLYQPAAPGLWLVDSPELVELLLSQGGQQFLDQHGTATLQLKLIFDRVPAWQAELLAGETGQRLHLLFDVTTGQLMD